ncbi:MAG: hypothetical protein K0R66_1782 [Gammaproteobacteria bacterium]|jgi:hypothetical protein|nr:hypothetical protein [Gammaproteobacteria bacterium]
MRQYVGLLEKMRGQLDEQGQVSYRLILGKEEIELNPLLGKQLSLQCEGVIHCVACKRLIKKSFQQGYCFPCTQTLAQCDICIVRPELCHHRHGTCREPAWGETHCMQSHYVYLANASGLKVGITKGSNMPYRWIDQGAAEALPILEVKNRYVSGLVEVLFKKKVADKTNWRKMLQGKPDSIDLIAMRDQLLSQLSVELDALQAQFSEKIVNFMSEAKVLRFHYPVLEYPITIKKADFNDQGILNARLLGIKGQYLIFDQGVMNVRNLLGHQISLSLEGIELETLE